MAQLVKIEEMIQERNLKIKEIKDTVELSKNDADRELAGGLQVLTALIHNAEKCRDDFIQMIKEKLKATEKQAEDLIRELEQEIEDLTNRSSEVKPLTHTKDHLHFLLAFRSLKDPPPTRNWMTVKVCPPSYEGTLLRSLGQLEETLNKLRDAAELKRAQQYEVHVTLDPDTAYPSLIVSEDGKHVRDGGVVKTLPNNPKRFKHDRLVLSRQSFSSRTLYFEVQVKDTNCYLGVARTSFFQVSRKTTSINQTTITPKNGYWVLTKNTFGLVFNADPVVHLLQRPKLQKVGVFVDYNKSLVSFFDVEARVCIYSAGCTFHQPLYPLLGLLSNSPYGSSGSLIISAVKQTD